jgi:hypothetical protein
MKNVTRFSLTVGILVATTAIVVGCCGCSTPKTAATKPAALPPAPPQSVATSGPTDYSNPARWLSAPTTGTKSVDVFYLYPTVYAREATSDPMVCAVDDPGMMKAAGPALARQASCFETVANIYAPYYRQADVASRVVLPQAQQVAVVAGEPTQDGIGSFDYYIKHYNNGRPFILASHSLGSNVMANLLAQYMKEHPDVYKRMVAAYVIGYSITPSYLAQNPNLKFAEDATDTGVIVSYNTEAPTIGAPNPVLLPGGLEINPISWTRTEATATADENLGSILLRSNGTPLTGLKGEVLKFKHVADARIDTAKGVIINSVADVNVFSPGKPGQMPRGVYHTWDYPFYYFDLRQNAADRVAAFLEKK